MKLDREPAGPGNTGPAGSRCDPSGRAGTETAYPLAVPHGTRTVFYACIKRMRGQLKQEGGEMHVCSRTPKEF